MYLQLGPYNLYVLTQRSWGAKGLRWGRRGAAANAQLLFIPHGLQGLHHPDLRPSLCQWHAHQLHIMRLLTQ
jgi:hypothetical protein